VTWDKFGRFAKVDESPKYLQMVAWAWLSGIGVFALVAPESEHVSTWSYILLATLGAFVGCLPLFLMMYFLVAVVTGLFFAIRGTGKPKVMPPLAAWTGYSSSVLAFLAAYYGRQLMVHY